MKKYLLSLVFLFGLVAACFSQEMDVKHYSDAKNGYDGYAMTVYLGSMADMGIQDPNVDPFDFLQLLSDEIGKNFRMIDSLTDNEYFIKSESLSDYDLNVGEFYLTLILSSYDATEAVAVITCETFDGTTWAGFKIREDEVDKFFDVFG